MKNLKNYAIVLLLFVFSGCSEDLESINYDEINPSIFPSSEADIQAIVASAYYPLRGSYGSGIHTTSENGLMFMLDATTEILQGPYGVQQEASLHSYKATSTAVTRFYDTFYNKISGMTLSIDRIEKSKVNELIKKQAVAEIKCARGLLAYELYDMYGPLVVAPLDVLQNPLKEEPLARLSNAEMVSFIEKDLKDAAADLKSPAETAYGRFSSGLARMILIRLYLHEKRWAEVEEQANAIIALNYYGLEDDYAGLWGIKAPTESREVIWAVPANYAGTSENQWQLMVLPANFPGRGGYGTIQSSWFFYDTFEATDIRKEALISEFTGTDGVTYNRQNPANYMQLGPIPLKIDPDAARTTALTTVDIIVYRYPDVLLSKAEAIVNRTGTPTQEAVDLVNIVRRRAKISEIQLANYNTLASFNNMILVERSHEYWCENGQYRSDLIRHGKFTEHALALNGAASQSAPYKALFPFSLARISEGKGKFIQNTGYN
nr:RagB/SusD family nutrient uptake outer membrane protein [uncultured Flavobacterium sp.]